MSRLALTPTNVPALNAPPSFPTLRAGDLYYDTVASSLFVYSGSAWVAVGSNTIADVDGGQPDAINGYSGAYPDTTATQIVTGGTP